MFGKIKGWWGKKTSDEQRVWLQALTVCFTFLGILYPCYKLITSMREDLRDDTPGFAATTIAIQAVPEEKAKQFNQEELRGYQFTTAVLLPNNSEKDWHNVVVKLPRRQGHYAVQDSNRNTLEMAKFQESARLQCVPAQATYIVSFWYNNPLTPEEHISISTTETGVHVLPTLDQSQLVSHWYQWAFWAEAAVLITLAAWIVYKWLAKQLTSGKVSSSPEALGTHRQQQTG